MTYDPDIHKKHHKTFAMMKPSFEFYGKNEYGVDLFTQVTYEYFYCSCGQAWRTIVQDKHVREEEQNP